MRTKAYRSLAILAAVTTVITLAVSLAAAGPVYVTTKGKHYHTFADCRAIKGRPDVVTIAEASIGDRILCAICAKRAAKASGTK